MEQEVEEFKTEVYELLDQAEKALLYFESLEEGASSPSHYDEVFRAYHNIKGAAGMMELESLQHHVHELENILMQTKDTSSIPKKWIGWFLRGNDVARGILNGEAPAFEYAGEGNVDVHEVSAEHGEDDQAFKVEASRLLVRAVELLEVTTETPNKDSIAELALSVEHLSELFLAFGKSSPAKIISLISSSLVPVQSSLFFIEGHTNTVSLVFDLVGQFIENADSEDLAREFGFMTELLTPFVPQDKRNDEPEAAPLVAPVLRVAPEPATPSPEPAEKSDTSVRVQISLLDRLMTLMGEMVLVRNQVLQYTNKCEDLEFLNLSQKLDLVTSELQEETMKTRMQPIGNVLSKFQRVVRDLSGTLEKKIQLVLIGVETELDKSLIEAVKDPLTHIVRNACDHGIETPAQRRLSGKPDQGTITINAYHEGGQVIVDIQDDGKGLFREALIRKAVEKGIIPLEKASELKDREAHALIFAPGFSTAEKVTNVSGRGVGMDVVKSNIEKIGGQVEITSTEGQGTKITLKIPLTLAIVPAMIVRSGEERFAIPQLKLVELVRVEALALESLQGQRVYRLRGNILPLLDLRSVLGDSSKPESSDEILNIVVLSSENNLFGLIVDEVLDTADIVVKPLARFLKPIAIYSGATVLGDGRVAFILDINGIAQANLASGITPVEAKLLDKYGHDSEAPSREYVLLELGTKTKHAVPLALVNRMEEFDASSFEYSGSQKVVRYRGGVLKTLNLSDLLGHPPSKEEKLVSQVIVVSFEDEIFGLEVGSILDVLSTRDYLDEGTQSHPFISGNLVTSNEIIVVVDVERIILEHNRSLVKNAAFAGARILLVEDTETIRNKIGRELSNQGYSVTTGVDGIDGLRQIAQHKGKFDLIISDIEMPRMNGFEFAQKVRSIDLLGNVPLIAFTTKNGAEDLEAAKRAGFTTYIEKSKAKILPLLVSECLKTKRSVA